MESLAGPSLATATLASPSSKVTGRYWWLAAGTTEIRSGNLDDIRRLASAKSKELELHTTQASNAEAGGGQPSAPMGTNMEFKSGTSRSGASVSSRAERPCRRTQMVVQPSRLAGGISVTPSATCAM